MKEDFLLTTTISVDNGKSSCASCTRIQPVAAEQQQQQHQHQQPSYHAVIQNIKQSKPLTGK
jgi:hypothetical protein